MALISNPTDPQTGQPLEPRAVLGEYANIIGLPLQGFTAHLAVKLQPTFALGSTVLPVFDLSQSLKANEYIITTIATTPVTAASTDIDILTPPNVDATYLQMSITLTTARNVVILIYPQSLTGAVRLFASSAVGTIHIPGRNVFPVFVPANFFIRVQVLSTNAADGEIGTSYVRVERPVGMGPFLF